MPRLLPFLPIASSTTSFGRFGPVKRSRTLSTRPSPRVATHTTCSTRSRMLGKKPRMREMMSSCASDAWREDCRTFGERPAPTRAEQRELTSSNNRAEPTTSSYSSLPSSMNQKPRHGANSATPSRTNLTSRTAPSSRLSNESSTPPVSRRSYPWRSLSPLATLSATRSPSLWPRGAAGSCHPSPCSRVTTSYVHSSLRLTFQPPEADAPVSRAVWTTENEPARASRGRP